MRTGGALPVGRPIRSITLEPFPADGFKEIEDRGTLRPNMPVTQQLRVVFDELARARQPIARLQCARVDAAQDAAPKRFGDGRARFRHVGVRGAGVRARGAVRRLGLLT